MLIQHPVLLPRLTLIALLTLVISAVFDLLFLTVSELPATVPVALALIVLEVRDRIRLRASLAPLPVSDERSARSAAATAQHPAGP